MGPIQTVLFLARNVALLPRHLSQQGYKLLWEAANLKGPWNRLEVQGADVPASVSFQGTVMEFTCSAKVIKPMCQQQGLLFALSGQRPYVTFPASTKLAENYSAAGCHSPASEVAMFP